MDDDQKIVDAEVVSEDTDEEVSNVNADTDKAQFNQASALMSLEELIKNHITNIDKLRDELKQQREPMLSPSLLNDIITL